MSESFEAARSGASDYLPVETPALIVDLSVMERNIERMATLARVNGVALRPHVKTHKSPQIAKAQLAAGAVGVTAATLREAEVMVEHGIEDVLIAFPLVGEFKLARLANLMQQAAITVSLDSVEVARGLSRAATRLQRRLPIYLEIDTGLKRVGASPGAAAVALATEIARLPGLELTGVMTHGGHVAQEESAAALDVAASRQAEELVDTAEALRRAGVPVTAVSPGGTLSARAEARTRGVTEIRPGTYVFNDANTVSRFAADLDECAAFVLATVVSTPALGRAVIDAGSKALSSDQRAGGAGGYGMVLGRPGVRVARLSEEHGVLEVNRGAALEIGEQVRIVPNHVCPAVNLSETLIGIRAGRVEVEFPVLARGRGPYRGTSTAAAS